MESSLKTNRMAIVSFVCGLISLLTISLIFLCYNWEALVNVPVFITDGVLMPIRNLSVAGALITGVLALREIRGKAGSEKGKILAWVGILLGASWILLGLLTGLVFLLSEALH